MSTIMDGTRASGTTTETIGLTLCTGEGAEVLYSQDPNLTGSNQANPIHSGGEANGAVVAMLGVDGIAGSKRSGSSRPGSERHRDDRAHHRPAERGPGRTTQDGRVSMSTGAEIMAMFEQLTRSAAKSSSATRSSRSRSSAPPTDRSHSRASR